MWSVRGPFFTTQCIYYTLFFCRGVGKGVCFFICWVSATNHPRQNPWPRNNLGMVTHTSRFEYKPQDIAYIVLGLERIYRHGQQHDTCFQYYMANLYGVWLRVVGIIKDPFGKAISLRRESPFDIAWHIQL